MFGIRFKNQGKELSPILRFLQDPKERYSEFLQRMIRVVQIGVADPEARQILIESLAYENSNSQCKKVLWPLKIRSAPLDEFILHTTNIESNDYGTEAWVGEAISEHMKRHKNTKCFSYGRIGHLKRNCRQGIPRNNASSRNNSSRMPQPSGLCRGFGKGQHRINEFRLNKGQARKPFTIGKLPGGGGSQRPP